MQKLSYNGLIHFIANISSENTENIRYGDRTDKSFGLIDDLSIDHNGNQISSVSDAVDENWDYEGAFDFADGEDKDKEYAYNGNGALTMDLNKGIQNIEYNLLGNPKKITLANNYFIEYVYAADGRRLRTKHYKQIPNPTYNSLLRRGNSYRQFGDSTDYVGNLILKNGKPSMYLFSGGYYSFDGDNKPECHYYIQDYQGNNRMVVNARTNEVEQTTHYYPYGGIIGNLSSNQEAQKYKYSGKELDRTYGLDLYDFHARLFNPALPVFDRPDPLAEDFTWLTPYNYCAGDPVNCIDPDGKKIKIVTSQEKQQKLEDCFRMAYDYLKSHDASGVLDEIINADYTVQISWTETDNLTSDYTGGIIRWNPFLAVEFNTGYVQSPAEALVHEAAHARNKNNEPDAYAKRTKKADNKYNNKEEKEVITKDEQECARKLGKLKNGQVTRNDHFGVETYRQEDPTKSEVEEPEI